VEGRDAICQKLRPIRLDGVELFVEPAGDHRFVLVLRGDRLGDAVSDPPTAGEPLVAARGAGADSERTAALAHRFVAEAGKLLRGDAPANAVTLSGFSRLPQVEPVREVFGTRAIALAAWFGRMWYDPYPRTATENYLGLSHSSTARCGSRPRGSCPLARRLPPPCSAMPTIRAIRYPDSLARPALRRPCAARAGYRPDRPAAARSQRR